MSNISRADFKVIKFIHELSETVMELIDDMKKEAQLDEAKLSFMVTCAFCVVLQSKAISSTNDDIDKMTHILNLECDTIKKLCDDFLMDERKKRNG